MFNTLRLYRLPAGINASPESLAEQLGRYAFRPCASNETHSGGWVEPHKDAGLVYAQNHQRLLCYQTEAKILPAAYINRLVAERVADIEKTRGTRPGRREIRELKEQVITDLVPKAVITKIARTLVWINNTGGWLSVDAASESFCDAVIGFLRLSLDNLGTAVPPIALPKMRMDPVECMTAWLSSGDGPSGFTIDRDCELRERTDEKGSVRYSRVNLDTDEVRTHIRDGKVPTRVALTWNDRISFVLEGVVLKRIRMLDVMQEDIARANENAADMVDSNFALLTGELANLIRDLVYAFGGEMPAGEPS